MAPKYEKVSTSTTHEEEVNVDIEQRESVPTTTTTLDKSINWLKWVRKSVRMLECPKLLVLFMTVWNHMHQRPKLILFRDPFSS